MTGPAGRGGLLPGPAPTKTCLGRGEDDGGTSPISNHGTIREEDHRQTVPQDDGGGVNQEASEAPPEVIRGQRALIEELARGNRLRRVRTVPRRAAMPEVDAC